LFRFDVCLDLLYRSIRE